MSSCDSHAIEIVKNFGESCERTNLLISGVIRNVCDSDRLLIRVNENDKFETQIAANRRFKRIIRLQENRLNTIEICYCRAKLSLKVLHAALNLTAQPLHFDVQPLYLIPTGHDGTFQTTEDDKNNTADAAVRKIDLIIELAQTVIASKLFEAFKGERCFFALRCKSWSSSRLCTSAMRTMSQWELYDAVAAEIIKTFGEACVTHRKFIVFMSSTRFEGLSEGEVHSQLNIAAKTVCDAALGGGFLCLMGSGSFYALPESIDKVFDAFNNKRSVDITQVIDNSNYRGTYGGCFATFLGSLIHEIGHIFDLAHTETGLMGGDVDYVHRLFLAENFTEILPKRNVKSCSLVDNRLCATRENRRVTCIKKPGQFMVQYHEQRNNEMTFFEMNCLITLQHHKWFTQNNQTSAIWYDESTRTIVSEKSPFALVELRKSLDENSLLVKFWPFDHDDTINKFTFPTDINLNNLTIFAITRDGCIFKN